MLIDDEYENSNTAFRKNYKVFLVISILITLGSYTPIDQLLNKLWASLSLTQ